MYACLFIMLPELVNKDVFNTALLIVGRKLLTPI